MIWAMGDLHLDFSGQKPMDIFGSNWENHEEKIFMDWKERVKEEDIVLLVGDISWALKIEDAAQDLEKLDSLPGKKFIIKGNHDYWWASMSKLEALGLRSIKFIHNTAYVVDGIGICGTRGWSDVDSNEFDEQDEKIYARELLRLQLSIDQMRKEAEDQGVELDQTIALLHYPPFSAKGEVNDFGIKLAENKINTCLYGHLHAHGHKFVVEGEFDGVQYHCVSSDYIDFNLFPLK